MSYHKRTFIKLLFTTFSTLLAASSSRIFADWPNQTFEAEDSDQTIKSLTNGETITISENINIKAPDIAENGAVVPITVNTTLPNVKSISIIVDNNPSPLTSSYTINTQIEPFVSTRVKMAKTSNVTAIVSTDSGYYTSSRVIKVTIGGCGG